MNKLLICIVLVAPCLLSGIGLSFSFDNASVIAEGSDLYFEFDLMLSSESSGSRLGTGMALVSYNPSAFGSYVYGSGNAEITRGTILADNPPYPSFYNLIVNDNSPGILGLTFEYMFSPGYGYALEPVPTQLLRLKLKVLDPEADTGIGYHETAMANQQFLDDNATLFNPVSAAGSLNHTLPVELASFSSSLNALNQVSLLWITQSETGVLGFRLYRAESPEISSAILISPLIEATNTSTTQSYAWIDTELCQSGIYHYWLENVDLDGSNYFHGPIQVSYTASDYHSNPAPQPEIGISRVFPNPFNPVCYIDFCLDSDPAKSISIYDLRGRRIRLWDLQSYGPGMHRISWDGLDMDANGCPSGTYILRLDTETSRYDKRISIIK